MSDPAVPLVNNPDLTQSLQATDQIADQDDRDHAARGDRRGRRTRPRPQRTEAIRDSAIVVGAMLLALLLVILVARSLVRPLRTLRDSALRVAHDDLAREIERVRAGKEPGPVAADPGAHHRGGRSGRARRRRAARTGRLAGRRAEPTAAAGRRHVRDAVAAQPLAGRPTALADRPAGTQRGGPRAAGEPVPARSPRRADAPKRRQPAGARRGEGAARAGRRRCRLRRSSTPRPPRSRTTPASSPRRCPTARSSARSAGDLVHLLAELLDNALRYSPPISQVRVSAVHTGNGGLVIEVSDIGLGMTESDLRVANTRLQSGGEVNPVHRASHGSVRGRAARRSSTGWWSGCAAPLRANRIRAPPPACIVPSELLERAGMRDQFDTAPQTAHLPMRIRGIATALALDEIDRLRRLRRRGRRGPAQRPLRAFPSRCCRNAIPAPAASPTSRPLPSLRRNPRTMAAELAGGLDAGDAEPARGQPAAHGCPSTRRRSSRPARRPPATVPTRPPTPHSPANPSREPSAAERPSRARRRRVPTTRSTRRCCPNGWSIPPTWPTAAI